MSCPFSGKGAGPTRRGLLVGAGGALASAGAAALSPPRRQLAGEAALREPFFGLHQGGIATPQQTHTYFAAFDCLAKSRDDLVALLRVWTDAAARMSAGETARDLGQDLSVEGRTAAPRSASRRGGSPSRSASARGSSSRTEPTVSASRPRPAALVDLPKFNGDQLDPAQRAATFRSRHAPTIRWSPSTPSENWPASPTARRSSVGPGRLSPQAPAGETPRNLMGFKDGTSNPPRARADVRPTAQGASTRRLGRRRRAGLDARRQLRCRPGASGSRSSIGTARRSTFRSRSSAGTNIPARRSARPANATLLTWTASTRTAIPSSPTIPMCGSERRRPTAGRKFSAGPIPITTASGSPRSAGPRGARA